MLARIRALAGAGIPVVAHLGLTPQTATSQGGYRAQGKTAQAALQLLHDAHAAEAAGAFLLVLEAVPAPVAERVSRELQIPTIGIGAGAGCDGQVLVFHDLLGLGEGPLPRFVERYASLGDLAVEAVARYAADVRERRFPEERHTYAIADDELEHFQRLVEAGDPVNADDEDGVL
jgi:3-methyl-2-oxobutanoate hydroxymethyltransferase